MTDKSNITKGRDSFDANIGGEMVAYINRNVTPYATSTLGPKFDLVPVERQKDIMLNVARMHAQQEYNRIMELVTVLQRQADEIKHRLDITDMVHAAKYDFQIAHGNIYWLVLDTRKQITRLSILGPDDWATAKPQHYDYIAKVKWLGDHTWIEVE
jgi:Protein of unknown function (DUF2452)